jgi:hypothetical protein
MGSTAGAETGGGESNERRRSERDSEAHVLVNLLVVLTLLDPSRDLDDGHAFCPDNLLLGGLDGLARAPARLQDPTKVLGCPAEFRGAGNNGSSGGRQGCC